MVVLDGFARSANVGVGIAQVTQVIPFGPPVPYLLGDGQGLLIVFDGFARLAQVFAGIAQVAQMVSFAPPVLFPFCRSQCRLQPANPLFWVQAQIQHVDTGFGVGAAERDCSSFILQVPLRPRLACLNVGPFPVE